MAKKLTNPTPVQLPSGSWRCQVMVNGKRISVVDDDPVVAHAKALALKEGIIEEETRMSNLSLTLDEAITHYIDDRRNVLSPSTVMGYEVIRKNRFPALMKTKVGNIEKADLQRAINAKL